MMTAEMRYVIPARIGAGKLGNWQLLTRFGQQAFHAQ
jgi:hypothetical protein